MVTEIVPGNSIFVWGFASNHCPPHLGHGYWDLNGRCRRYAGAT